MTKFFTLTLTAAVISSALLFSACDSYTSVPESPGQSQCEAGIAQIRIGDGWQQVLCGCKAEADGTIALAPAPLNCTIDAGTKVFFRFEAANTPHQIIPATGAPEFSRMGPAFPADPVTQAAFPVTFSTPATTFPYEDAFSGAMTGNIIVL